jgi:type II secretory pathway component PulF
MVLAAVPLGQGLLHRRRQRTARRAAEADLTLLGRMLLVALGAGLPLPAALDLASRYVHPRLAAEVGILLGEARRHGTALALHQAGGMLQPLCRPLARAQLTGASMRDTLAAYLQQAGEERRAALTERLRSLPVRLMVPVALLLLPGSVAVTVGPLLWERFTVLLGPLLGP